MNKRILELAKECDLDVAMWDGTHNMTIDYWSEELEAFYRAAFNDGFAAAAKLCGAEAAADEEKMHKKKPSAASSGPLDFRIGHNPKQRRKEQA